MLAWPALLLVLAASPPPDPAMLCQLALKNRPLDQLQARGTCHVSQVKDIAKSAMRRALIVEVPLSSGTVDVLMIEVAEGKRTSWQDLGPVGGEREDRVSGSPLVMRERSTLERFEVVETKAGPVIALASQWSRDSDDRQSAWKVERHDLVYCAFTKELVCLDVDDRWTLTVTKGQVPDLKPGAWTRTVSLGPKGELVVGAHEGSGELSPFDPGPGTHSFDSLAETPFVRRRPTVSMVHPDQAADPADGLELPALTPP